MGHPRFEIVNGKQLALLVAPSICFIFAAVAVAARWYTRSVRRINTLVEDALCLAALTMSFVVVTIVFILVFMCGEGLTSEQIQQDPTKNWHQIQRYWLATQFALDVCWATSIATIQLAFVKYYLRLYSTRALAQTGCYIFMGLIGAWYVAALAGWISRCHPPGRCIPQGKKTCIIVGSVHVLYNAIILLAPFPAALAAQISRKKKVSTAILFFLGCFCTIIAVLRIDCAITVFGNSNQDPIGASWWRACFSPIEIAIGIVCVCMPNVGPAPGRERPSLPIEGTGLRRLKFRTTSGSSSTSNLNPAHWMPGPKAQVNAFVTLENGKDKSMERVTSLGPHEIKVTKDYQLDNDRL